MKSVVVTGASTGIGKAASKALLASGFRVFGSVRKQADADQLAAELGAGFTPLIFDVTEEDAVVKAAAEVAAQLGEGTLAGLVNNAGIAIPGPLLEVSAADLRRQLEVNLVGQMIVTKAFARLLGTDSKRIGDKGRIVMVSSSSGRRALPFNGPYSASKFALEGLSESLRRELMFYGIDVIVVAPGAVVTPIWDKAGNDVAAFANSPFVGPINAFGKLMLTSGRQGLPASRIGETIVTALTVKQPKARYTVVPQPMQHLLMSLLPKRMVDRMLARKLGLSPANRH